MLRCVLLVSCFVILVQACDDHNECPLDLELLPNGDLSVEYHAPDGVYFTEVVFKLFLGRRRKLKEVDTIPEDHEDHEDWGVVFSKGTPFVECDFYKIRVMGKGKPKVKRTIKAQIPGPDCPAS